MDTALVNDSNAPHALFSNRVLDELFSLPLYIDRSSCSHIALLSSWTLPAQLSQAKTQVNVVGVETMRLATATSELVNFFVHAVLSSSGQQKVHRWLPHPWYHMTLTRALRVSYIASVAFMHICSNKIFDKCQFYQQSRVLFPDHNIVYRELGMLSKRLKVPSNKLHIVSGGKGMVAGFLSFTDCTKVAINVSSFLPGPYFIPQTPELLTNVNTHGRNGILL